MATDLQEFATERRDELAHRKTTAFDEFDDARTALDGPPGGGLRKTLAEKTADLADVNRRIAAARRALSGDLTPAELEARIDELRALIAERRGVSAEILDLEERVALEERELERARATHQRAGAALADRELRLAEAEARAARLEAWSEKLDEEPLASLAIRAKQARTKVPENADFKAAKKRIDDAIPKELRDRALERYELELDRLASARDAVREVEAALAEGSEELTGPSAEVAAARAGLARAERDLADFVLRGPESFDSARRVLAELAVAPVPTDAELAAVADAGLADPGKAAIEKERERDQARKTLADAEEALEAKALEVTADDVDADVPEHPDVKAAQEQVKQAKEDFDVKEDAYTDEIRAALDAWEAAVPDGVWNDLLRFERARRTLDALENTQPDDLETAVADAEQDLVTALETEDKALRTVDFLRREAEQRRQRLAITETIQERRSAAAVRGDR